ncbi:carbohydrate ABC transporter ATP-binding protein, CUT1 family [Ruegeria lacuscaerulensis ITI-1157]|nr:carbohydrate ABC transporter ATP-binding protein, CUT1 family [Ruegeria lacuscaerulensis ITI-1157]
MAPILDIKNLYKNYGATEILKDINISIEPGDFLVLVGPSGCGKSTLLNCIAGLEPISGGTLSIGGKDMTHVSPKDRDIAMVFQSYALYPTMSVAKNITFGMKVRGVDQATQDAKLKEVASLLQIEPLLNRRPSQLSGGQRQRVAMGRALVRDPKLFLFDEPLSNLDAKLRVEMRTEIKKLHQTLDASIVYVTHDQIEAMTLATKIVVLKGGVVQQIGTPAEIYNRPANLFVADFMGSPAMNLIPARVQRNGTGTQVSIARAGGRSDRADRYARPAPSRRGDPGPAPRGHRRGRVPCRRRCARGHLPRRYGRAGRCRYLRRVGTGRQAGHRAPACRNQRQGRADAEPGF